MQSRRAQQVISSVLILGTLLGCRNGVDTIHYVGDADLQYYKGVATEIAYPALDEACLEDVPFSSKPRTIRDRMEEDLWDMSLVEAIHLSLTNNKILKARSQFLSPGNPIHTATNQVPSVYDPAIQETGFLFGGRGVEAALSDFDAQFTTTMLWGRNETLTNNQIFNGVTPGGTFVSETGAFTSRLEKNFASGGLFGVSHNWNYNGSNAQGQLFPSSYAGFVRADYRQPLWAGAGTEFTRIAGPVSQSFGGITGVSQGVVIARINNDITIAEFEASVRNMVKDVEDLYWDLYLSYRQFDAAVVARNSALRSWREVKAKADIGARGGGAADEAQARENYLTIKGQVELSLNQIYTTETQMRRLLGLPVNDGRIIRPIDEPMSAEFIPDWHINLAEALTLRVELRRQKWSIKSLELQMVAAKSLTNPRLDLVSSYQVNGFGDQLLDPDDNPGGLDNAYGTLTSGDETGWNLGFEFTMPIGFRAAHAQVQNLELRLAKARTGLATQELEISHELATAFQNIDAQYQAAKTFFARRQAAERRVQAAEAEYAAGTTTLDLLLRAQSALANAEIDYFTAVIRYNQALAELHFRKGTLLANNNVFLSESEWTPEAYQEALRRAWARSYAFDADAHLETEPSEFAIPGRPVPAGVMPTSIDGPVPEGYLPPPPDGETGPLPLPAAAAPADKLIDLARPNMDLSLPGEDELEPAGSLMAPPASTAERPALEFR